MSRGRSLFLAAGPDLQPSYTASRVGEQKRTFISGAGSVTICQKAPLTKGVREKMRFATKLLVLFSGIFLVSSVSMTYFVYTSNLGILEKEIKDKLEVRAFHTMDKIDRLLYERYVDIRILANDPAIRSQSQTPEQLEERLRTFQYNYAFYSSLSFFDLNRVRIADTSGKLLGEQREPVEYWKDIAAGKEFVVNLHRSVTLNEIVMHFVHIVRDRNGIPFGVVVSRVPVEKLYDITELVSGPSYVDPAHEHLRIDLVDRNGLLLYSNYSKGVLRDRSPYWEVVKRSQARGERMGSVIHSHEGEDDITTFVRDSGYLDFTGNDWTLIVTIPAKVAFSPAVVMRNKVIGIFSAFGIASLVIIFLFSRSLSRPLLALRDAALAIGRGNLDRKVEVRSGDEIGQMAGALGRMAEDIKKHIAEQELAAEALKMSEAKIRALFNAIPDAIFVIGNDRVFRDFKAAYDFTTLVPPGEFIGAAVQDIMPPEVAQKALHHIDRAFRTGEIQAFDYQLRLGNNLRHYEARVVASTENEVLAIVRDITEHRALEEQLRHAQKMEAIGTLTGGVAHEFNNIMNAILGFGELLLDDLDKGSRPRNYVDMIMTAAERAAKLTKGLLTYSRRQVPYVEPVNISELLKTVESLLSRLIAVNVRLIIEAGDTALTVRGDRSQLEQILMNLASNALDAMAEGGTLTIRAGLVEFEKDFVGRQAVIRPGSYALISVIDTGAGIDGETQAKVFEPFFTTKAVGKGTGLGLSVVYGIVAKHNGYITVDSEPGKGSAFNVYLPIAQSAREELPPADAPLPGRGNETILLAEDDEAVRDLLRVALEKYGYRVIAAIDGNDAVEKYKEFKGAVQLLVLDVAMPGKNGREAYEEINKADPHIKALFMSGHPLEESTARAPGDEDLTFIAKPVSPKELTGRVRRILGHPRRAGTSDPGDE